MKRESKSMTSSLERRLNSYALAASAAGVSMLALAQPAEARIIYTPANVTIGYGGVPSYNLHLNHDGATDFVIHTGITGSSYPYLRAFANTSARGAGIEFKGHSDSAAALYRGARIGPKQGFDTCCFAGLVAVYSAGGRVVEVGNWLNVRNRYLGLKLLIKGKTHYGWARLNVSVRARNGVNITATLTGYAYETIPNKPIIAGKTHGKDVVTVQPASLGALAAGANGLHRWRQK